MSRHKNRQNVGYKMFELIPGDVINIKRYSHLPGDRVYIRLYSDMSDPFNLENTFLCKVPLCAIVVTINDNDVLILTHDNCCGWFKNNGFFNVKKIT